MEATLLGKVMKNRKLFHTLLRFGKYAQKPVTGGTPYLRHLPQIFMKEHGFRALPAIADKAFRDDWETIRPRVADAKLRVGLFSGCVQDFVYPEQMKFPMDQSCCGLPVQMMAERQATIDVARQNVMAFDAARYDYILTLCASCASHLKEGYPKILAGQPDMTSKVKLFASKVIDFSSFVHDVLGMTADDFKGKGEKVAYHASCHLCRGLGVVEQPRALIASSGSEYCQAQEEAVGTVQGTAGQEAEQRRSHRRHPHGGRLPRLHHADPRRRGKARQPHEGRPHRRTAGRKPEVGMRPDAQ